MRRMSRNPEITAPDRTGRIYQLGAKARVACRMSRSLARRFLR